ncbi:MAG: prenyltransferase [Thaumarchaeota archaeon]|nr:prenyltransferase [Nitrososphaerota archaeon]MCL5318110.1 prenyltransferase [Nitrososphaerota archaeon]
MVVSEEYRSDVEAILAKRYDNGGDYWASPDGRVGVGSPFSTLECVLMLSDLGMESSDPTLREASKLILSCWREDGRFQLAPRGPMYRCYTAAAARVLCRVGYTEDPRLQRTFKHLLDTVHTDGGWRCNSFKYGRGPETEFSNPGPTLHVLDAFRFTRYLDRERILDGAVNFLLDHWVTRKPLGPCHFGIGTLFMQVEYPLRRYNLLNYVYVLSFYERARCDSRFHQALEILESKLFDGKIVVENPHRNLANLSFCEKGAPSNAATVHYHKILENLKQR